MREDSFTHAFAGDWPFSQCGRYSIFLVSVAVPLKQPLCVKHLLCDGVVRKQDSPEIFEWLNNGNHWNAADMGCKSIPGKNRFIIEPDGFRFSNTLYKPCRFQHHPIHATQKVPIYIFLHSLSPDELKNITFTPIPTRTDPPCQRVNCFGLEGPCNKWKCFPCKVLDNIDRRGYVCCMICESTMCGSHIAVS